MQVRADVSSWVVTAATLTSKAGWSGVSRATRSRLISRTRKPTFWLTLSVRGVAEDRRVPLGEDAVPSTEIPGAGSKPQESASPLLTAFVRDGLSRCEDTVPQGDPTHGAPHPPPAEPRALAPGPAGARQPLREEGLRGQSSSVLGWPPGHPRPLEPGGPRAHPGGGSGGQRGSQQPGAATPSSPVCHLLKRTSGQGEEPGRSLAPDRFLGDASRPQPSQDPGTPVARWTLGALFGPTDHRALLPWT